MKKLMENWRGFLKEQSDEMGFPNMEEWWTEDPDKIMGFVYWLKGQLPPSDPEKKASAWENLKQQLEKKHPSSGAVQEAITLDIEVGDIVLGGKYKNKRIEVKESGVDDIGQPTINGKSLLKFRIEKQLPDSKKSKKTLDAEKEEKSEQ